jgi:protein TonB
VRLRRTPERHARQQQHKQGLVWLASILLHAGALLAIAHCRVAVPEPDDAPPVRTVSDFRGHLAVFEQAAEEPALTPPELAEGGISSVDVSDAWLPQTFDRGDAAFAPPEPPTAVAVALEDLPAGQQGDGRPAAGAADEWSAGSLEALSHEADAAVDWSRIRPKLIGRGGSAGHVLGAGTSAPGSGGGGGGQGSDGIAGAGRGFGAQDGAGNGRRGRGTETPSGPGDRGVFAERVTGGQYPERALRERREGVAHIKVEVAENGRVRRAELACSSGHADLDKSALDAARRWRFKPALRHGSPVAAWVEVPVRFVLRLP